MNLRLQRHLNFDENDLAMNRAGQMSPRQIEATRQNIRITKLLLPLFLVVFMSFEAALIVFLFLFNPDSLLPVVIVVSMSGSSLLVLLMVYRMVNQRIQDWEETIVFGWVAHLQGRVSLERRRGRKRSSSYYVLTINEQVFRVNRAHFLAFEEGVEYRIYYAEKSRYILTAELAH